MGLTAAAIAFAGVAVATSTVVSSSQNAKATKQAAAVQADQATKQRQLESDLASQKANQESETAKIKARNDARVRQRALAQSASGTNDTILTGPSGDTSTAPVANKTVIGA